MTNEKNPSGLVLGNIPIEEFYVPPPKKQIVFANENSYKYQLEKHFFPKFFDGDWKPILGETKERLIHYDTNRSIIDYYGIKDGIPTYVEVKNDRIKQKSLLQIVRYYCDCNDVNSVFNLYVICTKKIRPHREAVLNKLGIKLLDIDDALKEDLSAWM